DESPAGRRQRPTEARAAHPDRRTRSRSTTTDNRSSRASPRRPLPEFFRARGGTPTHARLRALAARAARAARSTQRTLLDTRRVRPRLALDAEARSARVHVALRRARRVAAGETADLFKLLTKAVKTCTRALRLSC